MAQDSAAGAPRRLFFVDWRNISTGSFEYVDRKGAPHGLGETWARGSLRFRSHDVPHGIRIVAEKAEHRGPILLHENPWERQWLGIITLRNEGGTFKAWGWCGPRYQENYLCYLESRDGLAWTRPNLGLVEFQGSRQNNLLLYNEGNRAVFVDPQGPRQERYKMLIGDRPEGVYGAVSEDGLHWRDLPEPLNKGRTDTQNIAYYDRTAQAYVLYHRVMRFDRRAVGRTQSATFGNFPESEVVLEASPADNTASDDIYNNCKTTLPGTEDYHLMFPTIYHRHNDLASFGMASSADGRLWQTLEGSPVWTTRRGAWDSGYCAAHPELTELPDGTYILPYDATTLPHKHPRGTLISTSGYAAWPRGRLAGLAASGAGRFTIRGLSLGSQQQIVVNAVAREKGWILVEAVGLPGYSFDESVPIRGNKYGEVVKWKTGSRLPMAEGQTVYLRFKMQRATLYSIASN